MTSEFSQLGLHPQLVQTVAALGYESPTPIQSAIIPLMLEGKDVIGQAQTGTGKTAAFALPILHNLNGSRGRNIQGLVLAPTRELALQVANAMHGYGKAREVRVLPVYGGTPYSRQIRRLKRGVDIVVGTPGRMLDLINQGELNLSEVRTVVLDEADEMLSMGFIEDITAILDRTPAERQTALFSATMPQAIRNLAGDYMQTPQSVTVEHKQLTVESVEQRYYLVRNADKLAALTRLFEAEDISSALIFTRTRVGSADLANALTVRGFPAEALNGDLSQEARERVLRRFRNNQISVLAATDVAARGLDIDDISHVFNYDMPNDEESYVHRIGRTGRAGKPGIAITLASPADQWRLKRIEWYTKQPMTQATLPTEEEIYNGREAKLLNQVEVWLKRGRCSREREIVKELLEKGHDPVEVAAVALKLARAEEKQRPIDPISDVQQERPRRGRRERNGFHRNGTHSNGRSYRSRDDRPRRDRGERGPGNFRDRAERNGRSQGDFRGRSERSEQRNSRSFSRESHEAGMVRLALNAGRTQGVRPSDIVGTIAYHANIPGRAIGKIYIRDEQTLVDVPEQLVDQVLAKTGNYRIGRERLRVERA